jgi:hypothetical protein
VGVVFFAVKNFVPFRVPSWQKTFVTFVSFVVKKFVPFVIPS